MLTAVTLSQATVAAWQDGQVTPAWPLTVALGNQALGSPSFLMTVHLLSFSSCSQMCTSPSFAPFQPGKAIFIKDMLC